LGGGKGTGEVWRSNNTILIICAINSDVIKNIDKIIAGENVCVAKITIR
jgi:hypothetical protein